MACLLVVVTPGQRLQCDAPACSYGDKAFATQAGLNYHKRARHSEVDGRYFPCNVSGCSLVGYLACTTQGDLERHKWTHRSEDPGNTQAISLDLERTRHVEKSDQNSSCDFPGCFRVGNNSFTQQEPLTITEAIFTDRQLRKMRGHVLATQYPLWNW